MNDEPIIDEVQSKNCPRCNHRIDARASRCPFCGADADTGEIHDEKDVVREVLAPRPPPSRVDRFVSTIRDRQGLAMVLLILVAGGALWLVTSLLAGGRPGGEATPDAVPLPEVFAPRSEQAPEDVEMPEMKLEYEGNPSRFDQWTEEEGAVAPPPEDPEPERASQQRAPAPPLSRPSPDESPSQDAPRPRSSDPDSSATTTTPPSRLSS